MSSAPAPAVVELAPAPAAFTRPEERRLINTDGDVASTPSWLLSLEVVEAAAAALLLLVVLVVVRVVAGVAAAVAVVVVVVVVEVAT